MAANPPVGPPPPGQSRMSAPPAPGQTKDSRIRSPRVSRRSGIFSATGTPSTVKFGKPLRVRIVIVGPETSGKSCIIKRYCEKRFVSKYLATIGIDYGATKIFVDKREVSVHIFDTSGSGLFVDVRNEFYRDAHGVLLVFDVTNRQSFDGLAKYLKEIHLELAKDGRDLEKTVVLLCANKTDVQPDRPRQVDDLEARLWADLHGFPYFETSASNGDGIGDMFHTFFSQIVRLVDTGAAPKTPTSARRVQLSPSMADVKRSASVGPPASPEQQAVMKRLRAGRDAYEKLGLALGATRDEVNKVYRKLAMLLHPDKTEVQGADDAFKLLGDARNFLLKTVKS